MINQLQLILFIKILPVPFSKLVYWIIFCSAHAVTLLSLADIRANLLEKDD